MAIGNLRVAFLTTLMDPRPISSNAFADFVEASYEYDFTTIYPLPGQVYDFSLGIIVPFLSSS